MWRHLQVCPPREKSPGPHPFLPWEAQAYGRKETFSFIPPFIPAFILPCLPSFNNHLLILYCIPAKFWEHQTQSLPSRDLLGWEKADGGCSGICHVRIPSLAWFAMASNKKKEQKHETRWRSGNFLTVLTWPRYFCNLFIFLFLKGKEFFLDEARKGGRAQRAPYVIC